MGVIDIDQRIPVVALTLGRASGPEQTGEAGQRPQERAQRRGRIGPREDPPNPARSASASTRTRPPADTRFGSSNATESRRGYEGFASARGLSSRPETNHQQIRFSRHARAFSRYATLIPPPLRWIEAYGGVVLPGHCRDRCRQGHPRGRAAPKGAGSLGWLRP